MKPSSAFNTSIPSKPLENKQSVVGIDPLTPASVKPKDLGIFELVIDDKNYEEFEEMMLAAVDICSESSPKEFFSVVIDMHRMSFLDLMLLVPDFEEPLKRHGRRVSPFMRNVHLIGPPLVEGKDHVLMEIVRRNGVTCNISSEIKREN